MPDWSKMDLIPKAGLEAWYQIDPAVNTSASCPDFSGKGRNLTVASNGPQLLATPLNGGELGYYFDGTRNPLAWSGSVTAKHIFAIIAFDKAIFTGCEGVLSGLTSGNVLTSKYTGTAFYPFGTSYRLADVAYADNTQQAPVAGNFALVELVLAGGGVTLDGIQIGKQLNLSPARLFNGWFLGLGIYSTLQDEIARLKWVEYTAMRYHLWPRDASGLNRFPFASNRQRSRDLNVEHYLSEPYEGDSKALVRDDQDGYQWVFTTRREEEYKAAEAFYEEHRPITPFVIRDHRYVVPRDVIQVFASGLREQGTDVTWRHNYTFETSLSDGIADAEPDLPAINWALDADVIANRTRNNSHPEQAVNGIPHTQNDWGPDDPDGGLGGWDSDAVAGEPADLIIPFKAGRQKVRHLKHYTLRDSTNYSVEPSLTETFSQWGNTKYEVYFRNRYGAYAKFLSVSGNLNVRREHDVPEIETDALLFRGLGTHDSGSTPHARLVEFQPWNRDPYIAQFGPLELLQKKIIANQWPQGLPIAGADSYSATGGPATTGWTPGSTSGKLTFNVFTGLTLNGYVYAPLATPPVGGVVRNAWIICLIGHETPTEGTPRVKYLVDRGFNVVMLGMPNFDPNLTSWTYAHSMNGNVTITGLTHDQFETVIEQDGTNILPLFLDQVFRTANWIRANYPAAKIHLTGHSGGGFMCSMAAALDDKRYFTCKNSNAGELPFAWDSTPIHVEQNASRPWWQGHDWPDLYAIAARYGKFTKSHNQIDPFFQARFRHHLFRETVEDVNAVVTAQGYPGTMGYYIDEDSVTHDYTTDSLQFFVDNCLAFEPGLSPVLDVVTTPVWAAYGVTELSSAYTGPVIRVRDSLNAEADIGLTGTPGSRTLDTAALSGNSPYKIVKVYDQSGNQGPAVPIGNDLNKAPWLNVADKSIRFLDTGDPQETGFQLPDMTGSGLTQAEAFMRRKLAVSPPVDGVGGWWDLGTSANSSHTPYSDGNWYDQSFSAERRGPFSHSGTLTSWHVMSVYSAPDDWAFRINSNSPQTDNTNVVSFSTAPLWGAGRADMSTYAKGYSTGLVIFRQKCSDIDRAEVTAGL